MMMLGGVLLLCFGCSRVSWLDHSLTGASKQTVRRKRSFVFFADGAREVSEQTRGLL